MPARLHARLTYANVMSTLALFIALGGTAYAGFSLPRNSVRTQHIAARAVRTADIAPGAVNTSRIADRSLTQLDFAPGTVLRGEPGPKGDQGGPGLAALEVIQAASANDSAGNKGVNATCPSGKEAIAGGASLTAEVGGVAVSGSEPDGVQSSGGARGWQAEGFETVATNQDWGVRVFAVCARVER